MWNVNASTPLCVGKVNGSGEIAIFGPLNHNNKNSMETVIKFNIIDELEEDWILDEYSKGRFQNLTDEHLIDVITDIIRDAIVENGVYYDYDDAERVVQEILPTISSIHNFDT